MKVMDDGNGVTKYIHNDGSETAIIFFGIVNHSIVGAIIFIYIMTFLTDNLNSLIKF